MSNTKTIRSSKKLGTYTHLFSRTKVFVPATQNNIGRVAAVFASGSTTTTSILHGLGDQSAVLANLNSAHLLTPRLTASGDEHCIYWKTPDNFYGGDDTHVWLVFANSGPTTTTVRVAYDVKYKTFKVVDYHQKISTHDSVTGEAIADGSEVAMDTDLDEVICMDGLTLYAPYRGMRGTINGGKLETQDLVLFKIEADAAPISDGVMSILGLEIDYAMRVRDKIIEVFEE